MTHRTADGLARWASLAALALFACSSSAADPEWKVGLAEDGSQSAPFFAQSIFHGASRKFHAAGFEFRIENFGFVGLAGILTALDADAGFIDFELRVLV